MSEKGNSAEAIAARLEAFTNRQAREQRQRRQRDRERAQRRVSGGVGRRPERQRRTGSIEQMLHWAVATEGVRVQDGHVKARKGVDILVILQRRAELGASIDGGGMAAPLHPDAALLAETLGAATTLAEFDFICRLAHADRRPPLRQDTTLRCQPRAWKLHKGQRWGKTEVYQRWAVQYRGRRVEREVRWVPITFINTPEEIEAERAQYRRWRAILDFLREHLLESGSLRYWTLTEELPPADPWLLTADRNLDRGNERSRCARGAPDHSHISKMNQRAA